MFGTPFAGRAVDRRGPDAVSLWCLLGVAGPAGVLTLGGWGGAAGLVAPAGGMVLLDVAVQCGQVADQARNFALRPEVRARINTAYMTCAFIGGSVGSWWLGVRAYDRFGRPGVTGLVAPASVIALARHLTRGRTAPEDAEAPQGAVPARPVP
ncbi:hypothetical protein AQI88_15760 [Streptomyces cellostaticus]|uniref:Uncharacterized protein n=1 Tax=Streptomyces cellostaticus TaxID=67285 RepID=A0A117PWP1_9ACTN|nr:hypothetical protein [Streptomyces cellostaticus]KUM95538.1 hypothetical protein AQI88_15760 [Streptomyces cellostaticus]GHI09890.1 hypothetical protein Scel_82110 [Streptomyces cellostaticus]